MYNIHGKTFNKVILKCFNINLRDASDDYSHGDDDVYATLQLLTCLNVHSTIFFILFGHSPKIVVERSMLAITLTSCDTEQGCR